MPETITRHPVDTGIVDTLNAAMAVQEGLDRVGLAQAPADVPTDDQGRLRDGYGIAYPLVSPALWGSMARPQRALTATYQVTWVGRSPAHAQQLADRGHAVLCARVGGRWAHDIATPGVAVLDRRCRERGSLEEGTGGLWQVADIYDMEVQADA